MRPALLIHCKGDPGEGRGRRPELGACMGHLSLHCLHPDLLEAGESLGWIEKYPNIQDLSSAPHWLCHPGYVTEHLCFSLFSVLR